MLVERIDTFKPKPKVHLAVSGEWRGNYGYLTYCGHWAPFRSAQSSLTCRMCVKAANRLTAAGEVTTIRASGDGVTR